MNSGRVFSSTVHLHYAANLRPLDRQRLNGVGIKKQGFIERAYEYALENVNFLPQYLTIEKFTQAHDYFNNLRLIFDMCTQVKSSGTSPYKPPMLHTQTRWTFTPPSAKRQDAASTEPKPSTAI